MEPECVGKGRAATKLTECKGWEGLLAMVNVESMSRILDDHWRQSREVSNFFHPFHSSLSNLITNGW